MFWCMNKTWVRYRIMILIRLIILLSFYWLHIDLYKNLLRIQVLILVYTLYNILKRILIMKNIPRQLQLISITTEWYLNKEMGFLRLPLLLITTFSVRIKYIRNITFLYFLDMHILHISRDWSNYVVYFQISYRIHSIVYNLKYDIKSFKKLRIFQRKFVSKKSNLR